MSSTETGFYHAILIGAITLLFFVSLFAVTILGYHKRKLALYKNRTHLEINSLEKERARIAGDLHDDLGASLSAIKLKLQCLKLESEKDNSFISDAGRYIDEAMLKLKRIAFNMLPTVLERRGLQQALAELLNIVSQSIPVNVRFQYNCPAIANETAIHMYRIVQEALNNMVKHSAAHTVAVSVKQLNGTITLRVTDNGQGFDKNKVVSTTGGRGLQNIIARADILNAKMFLTTMPGKGVDYLFKIPYDL